MAKNITVKITESNFNNSPIVVAETVVQGSIQRHLDQPAKEHLEAILKEYSGDTIIVECLSNEDEAKLFSNEIMQFLHNQKKWKIKSIFSIGTGVYRGQKVQPNAEGVLEIKIGSAIKKA